MIKKILKQFIPWMDKDKKIYRLYLKSNKWMKKNRVQISQYYSNKIYKKYKCIISPKAEIGSNLTLPHPLGIIIGEGVKIGDNCTIYQNVTLGRKNMNIAEYPTIGNNVIIYCNSAVIGDIEIGDNSIIGCNSVILKSVAQNSTCVGVVK